ncbi:PREDICTED: probable inactive leucine-rich repeat receptor-like protein kinase At3g03770 [Theobroma cacao]|uniref:Probable inactive leucine-rich repeat receptor-like protein kinase At3g03770 n=1 Tax=Theobroma cacao TaxID=3641 RepID=A0AB32UMH0_THECC|nr:PREDICTED: probable inactive leucine-rich repeat receptor-like protein kinase At3g03770 [Theobroma cacao]
MANPVYTLLFLLTLFHSVHLSHQLQPSQANALWEIQQLLNYPSVLSSFDNTWDFCNIEPTPSLTVVCYEDNVTQLHVIGNNGVAPLPQNFSIDAFFASLVSLSNLKVLSLVSLGLWGPLPGGIGKLSSLEILNVSSNYFTGFIPVELSYLWNLQTLFLDHNKFTGQVPGWLSSFHALTVLSLKNNSLFGTLPSAVASLENLRILSVANNHLFGEVPDLQKLTNLQVLDLENNYFGPHFPALHNKVVTLVLRNNSFQFGIPADLGSYYELQKLDISFNGFVGPFLPSLFALPSINYIDVSANKLTGRLFQNMSCNDELAFVNLSSNLLTGDLPACLQPTFKSRAVMYARNCLSDEEQEQQPSNFCHNEALAVKVLPRKLKYKRHDSKAVLASSIVGGIAGIAVIGSLSFLVIQRRNNRVAGKTLSTRLIMEKVSTVNPVKLLSDARYISETMKLGANHPAYRVFALEELKEATNNFTPSSIIGEGSHGQVYKGKLADGTLVAIRSLKMRKKHSSQTYTHHIETISKLRHSHLASALGHCFECCPDDSSVSIINLVFEFVPNGTLRGCISEGLPGQRLKWTQRIAAAIGVAKGIQFLHAGILPGVFSNNLKITDVLLDQNLLAKISSYNLPLLAENGGMGGAGVSLPGLKANVRGREIHEDKDDVYDIGVILVEILVGRPIMSQNDVMVVKDILQVSNKMDDTARRSIVDPTIVKECSAESLKTVMEICLRCLSDEAGDRPSVEDVLWTLQFAAQLQDPWRLDSHHIHHLNISSLEKM